MNISLHVADIVKGLEHNLQQLRNAPFQQAFSYDAFLNQDTEIGSFFNMYLEEMYTLKSGIDVFHRHAVEWNQHSPVQQQIATLETTICKGMEQTDHSLLDWKSEASGKFRLFFYNLGKKYDPTNNTSFLQQRCRNFAQSVDKTRVNLVKDILAFECYLDAQLVLQHTSEFSELLEQFPEVKRREYICLLPGGYHTQGTINANVLRPLKHVFSIHPQYNKMSQLIRH